MLKLIKNVTTSSMAEKNKNDISLPIYPPARGHIGELMICFSLVNVYSPHFLHQISVLWGSKIATMSSIKPCLKSLIVLIYPGLY